MVALAAGHGHLAHIARQAQPRLAFRAAEVFELLHVLQTNEELGDVCFEAPTDFQILRILSCALDRIPLKHAEERPYVRDQAQIIEDCNPGDAREQREHDAKDEQCERELIATVAAHHEAA